MTGRATFPKRLSQIWTTSGKRDVEFSGIGFTGCASDGANVYMDEPAFTFFELETSHHSPSTAQGVKNE
jgi:hypothetical protein